MAIFQDPPLPAHAPTPTPVPGPVRLVFRMHAAADAATVRVRYRVAGPELLFVEEGRPPAATVDRTYTVGPFVRAVVLDVGLVWRGGAGPANVPIDADVEEEATGARLAPTWTLTADPVADGGHGAAMFLAVTAGVRGGLEGVGA